MRVCPLTELGFRNAETWGKHLWPTAGAILPDPQWASPQLHWEHWGLAGPSVAVTHSCCALHSCHPVPWGCTLPWREPAALMQCRSVSEEALCAPALSRALPSDTHTHTAALPSSQISFLGRDIWATLRLVPRSQGVVPLHWGTLVTCTWVLVSLLCPGGYFSHGCSSKNSDIIRQRNLFSGWFYASRDQCCWHSSQCRVLLNLHQFRNHQWALGGEEGNNTQRFPLLAWAESSSSPEQCHSADAPAAFSHRRGFPLEPCSRMLMAPQEG